MTLTIPKITSQRVKLTIPAELLIKQACQHYKLGEIINFTRFKIGYEELNIKLKTCKGTFVIKIFSKTRTEEKIIDYIKGLLEFRKSGIPVPELLKSSTGYLFSQQNNYLCISKFFAGQSFEKIKTSKNDLVEITDYLTKIHQLKFKISPNYDPWGTANFIQEFQSKKKYLAKNDLDFIIKIVTVFEKINFKNLRKSIIHGDLQKQHVLKNKAGQYCILDLGCMDYNASIIDLGIFLAQFCFDETKKLEQNLNIFDFCTKKYLEISKLSSYELSILPILVKATFCLYVIQCSYLENSGKDKSRQTKNWLEKDKQALEILNNYC